HPHDSQADLAVLLTALGQLWLSGVPVDWARFYAAEHRRRVILPTYPFERQRYWVDAPWTLTDGRRGMRRKRSDISTWLYLPSWTRSLPPPPVPTGETTRHSARWLVFGVPAGLSASLSSRLRGEHQEVITVSPGAQLERGGSDEWVIDPANPAHYEALIADL